MDPYAPEFKEDVHEISASQKEKEDQESWSDPGVKPALLVNIFGGFLYGISIGFLAVAIQFNQYLGDCARYTCQMHATL